MKKLTLFIFIIIGILASSISYVCFGVSCETEIGDDFEYEYTDYEPVYLDRDTLESSIKSSSARPVDQSGKIYIKGDYLFINEKYEGIHVIDNSNPATPINLGFIEVPGNIDISIKDNLLLVDNAVDLVTVDIGSFPTITEVSRVRNIFPELLPPDLDYLPWSYSSSNRDDNTIIVGWERITY